MSEPKHLYVIGPVTGKKNRNEAAFEEARRKLEAAGYEVTTPLDLIPESTSWEAAMRWSVRAIVNNGYSGVAMIDGWEESKGAKLECVVSLTIGVPAHPVEFWLLVKEASDD